MIEKLKTPIEGCFHLKSSVFSDERGTFTKVYSEKNLRELNISTKFVEHYYSRSNFGVVRGLHFQSPPLDHDKLVYCVEGEVLDVIVDLRRGSPSYRQVASLRLISGSGSSVFIPSGMAHGFCVLSHAATLVYSVSSLHSPAHEGGVRWDSVKIEWPIKQPTVSSRDRNLPQLHNFHSPFIYVS